MGGSAASYLWGTEKKRKPPALELVDEGFDLWMANNSGTVYSQGHEWLTVQDHEFWKFDWSKMGVYDFPALTRKI